MQILLVYSLACPDILDRTKKMNALDLIKLNVEIENEINASGDLIPLPEKESALLSVNRHQDGYVTYFRYDVPPEIRNEILALDPARALHDHQTVQRMLARYTLCQKAFTGKGYYFAHVPQTEEFAGVAFQEGRYVVLVNGEPVSWAWTQDGSERAAELAVETLPAFRRRGYGRQVVAAWAVDVIRAGQVAFYSHKIGNVASEGLARSLGVVQYAVTTGYS